MLALTPYAAVASDTDSLADPVSAAEVVIVRTPDMLFLQLIDDVVVFGAGQWSSGPILRSEVHGCRSMW